MKYYAQLNENNICIGISMVKNEVNNSNMIEIENYNEDYLFKKYENGQWSAEKYIPQETQPNNETQLDRIENTLDLLLLKQEGII